MEQSAHKHGLECKEIFAQLSAYLDAELPEATCEEIQAHITNCQPCVEFIDSLRRTVELCHGHASPERPAPLNEEAREKLLAAYREMIAARKRGEDPCPPQS
ncbi:MAG: zf-HC2 domain-containing protein [Acidobacteriales bacterium]|nr:zf-HC2 domain-containing protein [Terriglobales bacterium]